MFLPSGPPADAHAIASGNLAVMAVVTSSTSVSFDHGRTVVVVANAPADAEAIVLASTQFDNPNRIAIRRLSKTLSIVLTKNMKELKDASVH